MASIWSPGTCKSGQCRFIQVPPQAALIEILQLCEYHKGLRSKLRNDNALFSLILDTEQAKSFACHEVSKELGIESSEITWFIDSNNIIRIATFESAQRKVSMQTKVDTRIGVGKVIIE